MGLPRKKFTYDDLRAVPEPLVAELIDGDLLTSPRPGVRHASAASALGGVLFDPFRRGIGGPGGWTILDEPELHLGEDVVVPDLAGWRRERFAAVDRDAVAVKLAPDWLCEVLSPSTARIDRARKLPLYARERVGHVWLIDPVAQTLESFQLANDRWTLLATYEGAAKVRVAPFDAIEIDLVTLWTP
ncbi:MAG TPA: Uma2 family endonuclease [Polyangia bacterium]